LDLRPAAAFPHPDADSYADEHADGNPDPRRAARLAHAAKPPRPRRCDCGLGRGLWRGRLRIILVWRGPVPERAGRRAANRIRFHWLAARRNLHRARESFGRWADLRNARALEQVRPHLAPQPPHLEANGDEHANRYADANGDSYRYQHADGNSYRHEHSHRHRDEHGEQHADSDQQPHRDKQPDSHIDGYGNCNSGSASKIARAGKLPRAFGRYGRLGCRRGRGPLPSAFGSTGWQSHFETGQSAANAVQFRESASRFGVPSAGAGDGR